MALDGINLTAGAGPDKAATDKVGDYHFQIVKFGFGLEDSTPTQVSADNPLPMTLDPNSPGVTTLGQAMMSASLPVAISPDQTTVPTNPAGGFTSSADITRPADTTGYAANDCFSDSTSAPTTGGFTLSACGRASGGSGVITDAIITTSNDAATPLQGEIWLFDSAVTNINDNSAVAVSDTEIKTFVGKIPFALEDAGNNGAAHVTGLNIGYTCVGSDDLRYLVKVKAAYTPASGEVLTVRVKGMYTS